VGEAPQGHLISLLDGLVMTTTARFVRACRSDRGEFKPETAKLQLRDLWKSKHTPDVRVLRPIGFFLGVCWLLDLYYDLQHEKSAMPSSFDAPAIKFYT
jgi:hypothetical protein